MRISICIPTRERAEYLAECLATCVAIADPELEIIVSDNASEDHTRAVVEQAADNRIRYINTGQRLSMRQNFERCVSEASGEYIIIIGDDDAMVPGQFALLKYLLEVNRPECLSWRSRYYLWPDQRQADGGGRLKLSAAQCFGGLTRHSTDKILQAMAASELGGHDVVPMIYHGAASRSLLERLRARTGGIFLCSVPDVYFQVAANSVATEVLFAEHPFSIQAISPKSTGFSARFAQGGHDGAIAAFSREAENDPVMDPMPGRLPGIELYWLNALEQANRRAFGGTLPIRYDRYIGKALRAMGWKTPDDFAHGLQIMRHFVVELADGKRLTARIDAARRVAGWQRLLRQADDQLKRLRRYQPSLGSEKRFILDLKALKLGTVQDAARILDHCLGDATPAMLDAAAAHRSIAMTRGRALVQRALLRRTLDMGSLP